MTLWTCPDCGLTLKLRNPQATVVCVCKTKDFVPQQTLPEQELPSFHGVGWHLHRLIREETGEDIIPGCGCEAWMRKLDQWGPDGCREHRDEIAEKMVAEAAKRGWNFEAAPDARVRWAGKLASLAANHIPGGEWVNASVARLWCLGMIEEACCRAEAESSSP